MKGKTDGGLVRLEAKRIAKPWGRRDLPQPFARARCGDEKIGEIVFEGPAGWDGDLLVKYLFTSERLSVQVHPGEADARARGFPRGKDEAWIVCDAAEGGEIGIGLDRPLAPKALRRAALDGSVEKIVGWRAVAAGDCFYSPAGTIHAIGAGVGLVEVQQNVDVTYRLYDYGRDRELHLDEAVAVARTGLRPEKSVPRRAGPRRTVVVSGPALTVERVVAPAAGELRTARGPLWIVPQAAGGRVGDVQMRPGEVWAVREPRPFDLQAGAEWFVAYSGAPRRTLWG
jgi:mannose-6-phosphate isomerase